MGTAECKAWCEHAWAPWANGLLKQANVDFEVECKGPDFKFMKAIGAIEVVGYLLLWISPKLGAFILTALMVGAIHFHMTFLGDKPEALGLQFALVVASALVFLFDSPRGRRCQGQAGLTSGCSRDQQERGREEKV